MSLKKVFLMLLMIAGTLLALYLKPNHKISADRKDFSLEKIVPVSFADWKMIDVGTNAIVNPQQNVMVNRLYNQTLSRTYVSNSGERVMLVIAYGDNQTDNTQLHYPEVCYPAQGFQIVSHVRDTTRVANRVIPITKLIAELNGRIEPVTYWATIGDRVVVKGLDTKFEQLKYGLRGSIPDGLLFRVSSIGHQSQFTIQNKFINDLVANIDDKYLPIFIGSH